MSDPNVHFSELLLGYLGSLYTYATPGLVCDMGYALWYSSFLITFLMFLMFYFMCA